MNRRYESSCHRSFCGPEAVTARQDYYFGKMLTASGLEAEQRYLNEKRWLINRYGIGWGVICGLKVVPDPCNPCNVIVQPGMALDCYGNEIIVCKPHPVSLQGHCRPSASNDKEAEMASPCITIRYKECKSDPSPIPVEECGNLETHFAYNRTIETYQIEVSGTCPEVPKSMREDLDQALGCKKECTWFLNDPSPAVIEKCPPRKKWCEITLACVCCREGSPIRNYHIDNISYRKLAYSNELLYELISCLRIEVLEAKGARSDRRRYVPLLANTIIGLTYRDGRNTEIKDAGIHPHRLTSDGEIIWVTDQESPKLIRINRKDKTVITNATLDLSCRDAMINSSWGIAFDGKYMWITHNNSGPGKLTRINTCDLTDCWTFHALPCCEVSDECRNYCMDRTGAYLQNISEYPQEVVYHNHLLYVSHGCPPQSTPDQTTDQQELKTPCSPVLRITIIDTQRCCILTTVSIESTDGWVPVDGISAMASDGEALWITYKASHPTYDQPRPVVRRVKYSANVGSYEVGSPRYIENGTEPQRMAFDGTHLWVTHDNGATRIDLPSGGLVHHIDTDQSQTAIAYGGSDNIWSAEINILSGTANRREARLNRIDIHSAHRTGEIEFMRGMAEYLITDAQFDGSFIYISGYYSDAYGKKGVLHRILP